MLFGSPIHPDGGTYFDAGYFEGELVDIGGLSVIEFAPFGELSVSSSSEGLATITFSGSLSPSLWTQVNIDGTATIEITGLVAPLAIPEIPTAFADAHRSRKVKVRRGRRSVNE